VQVRRLIVFSQTSLDGRFSDADGDMSFAHNETPDGEWDEFVLVLGRGRTMFEGVSQRVPLGLTSSRTFRNGNVLLCYQPKR
jgi:hypothetical protein